MPFLVKETVHADLARSSGFLRMWRMMVVLLVVFIVLVSGGAMTEAATLSLSPSGGGSYSVGQTFTVPVYVSTAGGSTAMNAVSTTISYPRNLFDLLSIDKNGSIINFWIREPAAAADGSISLEGGVYNPGYAGSQGRIVSLIFKAKAVGTGSLTFGNASVLANDGQGTNILSTTGTAVVTIRKAAATPTPTPIVVPVVPVVIPTPVPVPAPEVVNPPHVDTLPATITEGDELIIRGTADVGLKVTVFIRGSGADIHEQSTVTGTDNKFSIVWGKPLAHDAYAVNAEAVNAQGTKSVRSPDMALFVKESVAKRVGWPVVSGIVLVAIIATLLILLISWLWYLIHKVAHYRDRVTRDIREADRHTHARFRKLEDAVSEHVRLLKGEQQDRKLTEREEKIVEELGKLVHDTEDEIEHEVQDIGK
ncbi:MAG: cohesin domain-containing protein [Patescibacteria group bacterium]